MRYPKRFARWRVAVWGRRLAAYREQWHKAEKAGPGAGEVDAVPAVLFWERLVTQALVKRVLWRKRAGMRKLSEPTDRPEA
jgi:hypothetical protein